MCYLQYESAVIAPAVTKPVEMPKTCNESVCSGVVIFAMFVLFGYGGFLRILLLSGSLDEVLKKFKSILLMAVQFINYSMNDKVTSFQFRGERDLPGGIGPL